MMILKNAILIRTTFFSIFLVMAFTAHAQVPQNPTVKPGKPQLPVPKIKPLKPADLVISTLTFVSITQHTDTKSYVIKVTGTIKNSGELKSAKTRAQAYAKTPSGSGSWKTIGEAVNINPMDPGASVSATWSFKGTVSAIGVVPFDFRVEADPGNLVTEADETNNYSTTIIINPRAH